MKTYKIETEADTWKCPNCNELFVEWKCPRCDKPFLTRDMFTYTQCPYCSWTFWVE